MKARQIALCLLAVCGFAAAAEPRPSFVVILADDLRYASLGSSGNREVITSRLDALAREGARFTQSFVTLSICSPSRAANLTGTYGTRISQVDYYCGGDDTANRSNVAPFAAMCRPWTSFMKLNTPGMCSKITRTPCGSAIRAKKSAWRRGSGMAG